MAGGGKPALESEVGQTVQIDLKDLSVQDAEKKEKTYDGRGETTDSAHAPEDLPELEPGAKPRPVPGEKPEDTSKADRGGGSTQVGSGDGDEACPSLPDTLFGIFMLFIGVVVLTLCTVASLSEFLTTGGLEFFLLDSLLILTGVLLCLTGIAAMSSLGTAHTCQRILALFFVISGFCVLLSSPEFHFIGLGTGILSPAHLVLFASIALACMAFLKRNWILRVLALAAFLTAAKFILLALPDFHGVVDFFAVRIAEFRTAGWGPFISLAVIFTFAFTVILHFVRIRFDEEKSFTESFFSYLGPLVLLSAAVYAVTDAIYRDGSVVINVFRHVSIFGALIAVLILFVSTVVAAWRTGNSLRDDIHAAGKSSWGWAWGVAALIFLFWLDSGYAGFNAGMFIVNICILVLIGAGWGLKKSGCETQIWSDKWEAVVFLVPAFVLVFHAFPLITALTGPEAHKTPFFMLPSLLVWLTPTLALFFAGICKSKTAYQYHKLELFHNNSALCRFAISLALGIFGLAVAFLSGSYPFQYAVLNLLKNVTGYFKNMAQTASAFWPFSFSGEVGSINDAVSAGPLIILLLALIIAAVFWGAGKKFKPASYIAGILSFVALTVLGLYLILLLPLFFQPGAALAAGQGADHTLPKSADGVSLVSFISYLIACGVWVRCILSLPAFFRQDDLEEIKSMGLRSYGSMLSFGALISIVLVFIVGMLAFEWGGGIWVQLKELGRAWANSFVPVSGTLDQGWYGYRIAVLISLFVTLAFHVELLRGERTAWLGTAIIWTFFVSAMWAFFLYYAHGVFHADSFPENWELITALSVLLVLFTARLMAAWISFLSSKKKKNEQETGELKASGVLAFGRIGAVGIGLLLLLHISLFFLMQENVLDRIAAFGNSMDVLSGWISASIEAIRLKADARNTTAFLMKALWGISLLSIPLFYIAQFEKKYAGKFALIIMGAYIFSGFILLGIIIGGGWASDLNPAPAALFGVYCATIVLAVGFASNGIRFLFNNQE